MKRRIIFVIYGLLLVFTYHLRAVLDGTTGNFPIELDTTYSFSNFEWARGFVTFNSGFDVPADGTVFLGVNQEINGDIVINRNGTLVLESDLIIGDKVRIGTDAGGYIITNNYAFVLKNYFLFNTLVYIVGDLIFDGMGTGQLDLFQQFVLLTNNNVTFENLILSTYETNINDNLIVFLGPNDRKFTFNNITTLNNNGFIRGELDYLDIYGQCNLDRNSQFTVTEDIRIIDALYVDLFSNLQCKRLILGSGLTSLTLENSTLTFSKDSILASHDIFGFGNLIIAGKSTIKAQGLLSDISIDSRINTTLLEGAQLSIEPNTHLIIN